MRGKVSQTNPLEPKVKCYGFLIGAESTLTLEQVHRRITDALGPAAHDGKTIYISRIDVEALGEIETLDEPTLNPTNNVKD